MVFKTNFVQNSDVKKKNITLIFGTSKGRVSLFTVELASKYPYGTSMKKFNEGVAALAKNEDYLFVSTKPRRFKNFEAYIYRCNFDGKRTKLAISSCEIFHKNVFNPDKYIDNMVVVNDTLFASRTDGAILHCSITEPKSCKTFNNGTNKHISGIDYDPASDKIYATLYEGFLWRCTPTDPNSCEDIYTSDSNVYFSALRVAYGAVWIASWRGDNYHNLILKCPLAKINETEKCHYFFDAGVDSEIQSINNDTNGNLYFNTGIIMWKLKPDKARRADKSFSIPRKSQTFIFV